MVVLFSWYSKEISEIYKKKNSTKDYTVSTILINNGIVSKCK